MPDYDFIIAGGGVSGLSLAYRLAHSRLNGSILVIEREGLHDRDHCISFWAQPPAPFERILLRSWRQLQIRSEGDDLTLALGDYGYHLLRRADFSLFIAEDLAACGRVEFLKGTVKAIEDSDEGARVRVDGADYRGKWVFDSRFQIGELKPDPRQGVTLWQHFRGWEIETQYPAFDPQLPTLFDFRLPQKSELRFFYVLPFSERRALVEYVLLSLEDMDQPLRDYIETTLSIRDYRIVSKEGGVTPLTSASFPRRVGKHVMTIGIAGGRVKPSSGYAFSRIQKDAEAVVRSLEATGSPFNIPEDASLYRFCDAALLDVMKHNGEAIKPIYLAMFQNNPVERVFDFLDETASFQENLALARSLPLQYFPKALLKTAGIHMGISRRVS